MIFFPLLALLIGYVVIVGFITYFIGRRFATVKAKAIVMILLALVFVAIPTADHAVGYVVFKHYCEAEAGTKIYRTVENVEGFRDETGLFGYATEGSGTQHIYGYKFVESKDKAGDIRYALNQDKVLEQRNFVPKSIYQFTRDRQELGVQVVKIRDRIDNMQNKTLLAERNVFYFHGGWLSRELSKIGGVSDRCPTVRDDTYDHVFVSNVLKPVLQK